MLNFLFGNRKPSPPLTPLDEVFTEANESLSHSGAKMTVEGKQTWEVLDDPSSEHDLEMLMR